MKKPKTESIRIPAPEAKSARAYARKRGMTLRAVVAFALRDYLKGQA